MQPPTLTIPAGGDALRAALAAAPAEATMRLSPGVHVGPFVIARSVTLTSRDPAQPAVLRGAGEGALLPIDGRGVTVTLVDLELREGGDTNSGGLIRVANGATLVLERCRLLHGQASGYGGGGLFLRRGQATLRDCRLEACDGRSGGALLVSNDAELLAEGCVFVGNTAQHAGAALAVRDHGKVTLRRCDLSAHVSPASREPGLGWLVDAHLANDAAAVRLEACKLPEVRDGAVRLR